MGGSWLLLGNLHLQWIFSSHGGFFQAGLGWAGLCGGEGGVGEGRGRVGHMI